MKIYHPACGVGGALKENSFAVIDDSGVEIGNGSLDFQIVKKMMPDRPLHIEMRMEAHPVARDTLFGALCARAESIKSEQGDLPARLFIQCAIEDKDRHEYFMRMGFDDFDGDELFSRVIPTDMNAYRKNYSPLGTSCVDVELHTRTRREEFLLSLKEYGYVEHASEWLEERMRSPMFVAKALYQGNELIGKVLITGIMNGAMLEMVYVEPKWRGRGAASAMIEEAMLQLSKQGARMLWARSIRRNLSAIQMLKRSEFNWVRTSCYLLGKNL